MLSGKTARGLSGVATRRTSGRRTLTLHLGVRGSQGSRTRSIDGAFVQSMSLDAGVSPVVYVAVLSAGLASSLSPCTLSVLPLTIGYIGGFSESRNMASDAPFRALSFAAGLATTLTLLGVISTALGKTYGQTGSVTAIGVGCVATAMGLNLLGVLPLQFPSLNLDLRPAGVPGPVLAFAAGLTFALASSPCSTPILATILAFSATSARPLEGASLLFVYSLGYVFPLLVAATATETMTKVVSIRQYSGWVTPLSGALMLSGGTFTVMRTLVNVIGM